MNINDYMASTTLDTEKPLDRIVSDGGFCGIFRTIACVGDSMASGEFESTDELGRNGYHDFFDYSWGQYIARMTGAKVYNFSRGGMTAKEYCDSFADCKGYWADDKLAQAYIIGLGENDFTAKHPLGSVDDIDLDNYKNNADTFVGNYARIIQRYKSMQPKARFFIITMPRNELPERDVDCDIHAALMYDIANKLDYTYVIDLARYAPRYDAEFRRNFYLGGHLNAAGYLLTAKILTSYIDFIIRNNPEDFAQISFVGTPFHNHNAKW